MQTVTGDLGTHETFLASIEGRTLTVTLNRPARLNALSRQLQDELRAFWPEIARRPEIRVVVVTGSGRAFSAGADIGDLESGTRPDTSVGVGALNFCPGRVLDVPVIAAVNGMCIGGALNFVADADIAIAARQAWFTDPHVTQGQVSGPEPLSLSVKASYRTVLQMALCGSRLRLSAEDALAAGLVSEVVPAEQLLSRAGELASMIAAQSPTAVRKTLALMRRRARAQLGGLLDDAWDAVVGQWSHPDAMEGPAAFAAKRLPDWADPEPSASRLQS